MFNKSKKYTISQCKSNMIGNAICILAGFILVMIGATGDMFGVEIEDTFVRVFVALCAMGAILISSYNNAKIREIKGYLEQNPGISSACYYDLENAHRNNYQQQNYNREYHNQQNQGYRPNRAEPSSMYEPPKQKSEEQKRNVFCTECGATLRLPVGKGKLHVTCPKCHNQFDFTT